MIPSIYLILPTRHQKKNGKYPLKVRVVYNRIAKDFKTGIDLTLDEFHYGNVDKPKAQFKELSIKLTAIKSRANKIIEHIGIFTFQKFEEAFYRRLKDAFDLFSFYKNTLSH
jgi:integrase/recombinase XerD